MAEITTHRRKVLDPCRNLAKGILAQLRRDRAALEKTAQAFLNDLHAMRLWGSWARGDTGRGLEFEEVAQLVEEDPAELQLKLFRNLDPLLLHMVFRERGYRCPICEEER